MGKIAAAIYMGCFLLSCSIDTTPTPEDADFFYLFVWFAFFLGPALWLAKEDTNG